MCNVKTSGSTLGLCFFYDVHDWCWGNGLNPVCHSEKLVPARSHVGSYLAPTIFLHEVVLADFQALDMCWD